MRNLTPLLPPKIPRVDTALYVVERDVMVPTRDGVRLVTDNLLSMLSGPPDAQLSHRSFGHREIEH